MSIIDIFLFTIWVTRLIGFFIFAKEIVFCKGIWKLVPFIQLKVQAKASEEIKGTVDDAKLFFWNLLCWLKSFTENPRQTQVPVS